MKREFFNGRLTQPTLIVTLWALAFVLTGFAQNATDDDKDQSESGYDPGYRYQLKEITASVNSKGLKTTRLHNRIEIQKSHAVNDIGDVSIPYNAFRSEARVTRAFTQTPDGRVVELKKDSVRDLIPDEMLSYQMYTDAHQLTFSMPGLSKGAIMDYEVEIEEKKPVMPGEFWISEYLDSSALVCTSRVSMTFPAQRAVFIEASNLPTGTAFKDTTKGESRTLTWEATNLPALEYESGMPPYDDVRSQVHLTSIKSWQEVESWYAGLLKKPLSGNDEIKKLAQQITEGLTNQAEQIQALYRYASHDIRYVGVELGLSAYEPHPPRETMRNKYGDCKDKSALLVSLLNAIGIQSYLALARPNYDGSVDQKIPGPFQFNHAIVYVPRKTGDLWIDATQPFGNVAEHGYHLDDIDALVVGLPGKTFVHVSTPDASHSVHRLTFDVDVRYGGLCTVHEIQDYTGRAAMAERERRSKLDTDKVRKQLEHNFNSDNGYSRLLDYSFTSPTNDCQPVRICVGYESDTFFTQTKSGLTARFDASEIRDWLDVPRPDPTSVRKHKRLYPWVSRMAHTEEIVCRLHLPRGYELSHTPTPIQKDLPHGKVELLFEAAPAPTLTLRLTCRPAQLDPSDLSTIAEQVDQAIARLRANLDIADAANDLIREHRYAQAENIVRAGVLANTNSADAWIRLACYYKTVGRVYQTQLALEKAIALAPNDPRGYELLADTYSGYWGIPGEGYDWKAVMSVYNRALTNVPSQAWTISRQAEACLIDDCGRDGATNRLDKAELYFRQLLKDDEKNYVGLFGLGKVARLRGKFDEAENYYRKAANAKPDNAEPRAGIWITMASAGQDEAAYNAISAYYGTGQAMNAELARVAQLMTLSRHYRQAADLYDRLVESAERPDVLQKLIRMLRKMEKNKRDDYQTCYDDSTPEQLGQTMIIASLLNDTNRLFQCLSPIVNRSEAAYAIELQYAGVKAKSQGMDIEYMLDAMLTAYDVSKRTLDNGDALVKFDSTKSATANYKNSGNIITLQAQKAGDSWKAITTGFPDLDNETLAYLSLEALDRGNMPSAISYQTRIANVFEGQTRQRSAMSFINHLREIAFTNDAVRVKAWAGAALTATHNRAHILQGLGYLEELADAYPEDTWIKGAVAFANYQTANVKKAAAVLDSININKLANANQLIQLARLLAALEKLDAADRVIARLHEVAPDDEKMLAAKAHLLTLQSKYDETATAFEKCREQGKQDSSAPISEECFLLLASQDTNALRKLVDRVREPGMPIGNLRALVSDTALALGFNNLACEQIATMIAEGSMTAQSLLGYAKAAIARGDIAEARDLTSRADVVIGHSDENGPLQGLCVMRLVLGNYSEAAHLYYEHGLRRVSDYSGYLLCMSALTSQLAGDKQTAAETLKIAATMQGDSDWPRLAIQYVNAEISDDDFRRAPEITATSPLKKQSRECEVNCIIGLVKEVKHDIPGAIAAYQASLATKSVADTEYFIAQLAVRRLQNTSH